MTDDAAKPSIADFYNVVARRKLNQPDDWCWSRIERVGPDATQVTGGVPRRLTRGPNKGRRRWDKATTLTCIATDAEIKAAHAEYEAETGSCSWCFGSGKSVYRVSVENGAEDMPCRHCGGTGKAASK